MTQGWPFGGLLPNLFHQRSARLDADRDQHHLASMLISIAAGRDEVSRADIRALLAETAKSSADRVVRINHAVKLAGTVVSGAQYDAVVTLAREFTA